jgi:uncharacterized protein YoxC
MNSFLDFLLRLNPLIQALTLIALIIYVWKTWSMADATSKVACASEKSICEMRLSREEQAKPKVVCYFEHNRARSHAYDFVIKNCGYSAAFNVRLVFSPQLERYRPSMIQPVKEKTFKIMAPGYEWRTFWDSFPGQDKSLMPDEFIANVSYDWDNPQKHETYEVHFDTKSLMGKMWRRENTVEDSLQEIAETVKNISNDHSLQEIAESVKTVAKALEKQTKAKGYRGA